MCALRAHIKPPIFENIFLKIEKVLTVFSVTDKMFLKLDSLICALRTYMTLLTKDFSTTSDKKNTFPV